jgi:stage II sporulation protein D
MTPQPVNFPKEPGAAITLANGRWVAGGVTLGTGELTLTPGRVGAMLLESRQYRGRYRLVPSSPTTFDVINDVDVDGYLKGVLAKELYPNWEDEAYKAVAIAARTYAIYESRSIGSKRAWDLFSDERSQVYGGLAAETSKSVRAVDTTAGVVVAAGPAGQERIFKAYFSSCCGGVTQSARDAFGDDYSLPLSASDRGKTCSGSNRFTWGPVVVSKQELGRRFALWAKQRSETLGQPVPEQRMQGVARIDQAFLNERGRPVLFYVTDNANLRFMMKAEDVRTAICTDAPQNQKVWSGSFKTVNQQDSVQFVEGHGFGHGVGLCQWCAQSLAAKGWRSEDIVVWSYPTSKLIRAY